jgi:hypothetical protein
MRKAQFLAVFWTLFLAIPLTALALSLAAYLTDHLVEIANAMANFGEATTVGGRGWAMVISERWPEVAGMIVGQLVIMAILLLVRKNGQAEGQSASNKR